jgi:hypothetical protein
MLLLGISMVFLISILPPSTFFCRKADGWVPSAGKKNSVTCMDLGE